MVLELLRDLGLTVRQANVQVTYQEFMSLGWSQRVQQFRHLSATNKATLERTHAEQWLQQHRSDLSEAQIAVVQETIDFITPELYLNLDDPRLLEREAALKRRLTCTLGREQATQAFKFLPALSNSAGEPAVRALLDSWLTWFSECVLR